MKGNLIKKNDNWYVLKKRKNDWKDFIPIPVHPDDEEEYGQTFENEMDVEYEVVDLYEGEKLPWYFAKLIK